MYKLNLKKINKIEKKYKDSLFISNLLARSIDSINDLNINELQRNSFNFKILSDLKILKEEKTNKKKKSSKK